MISNRFSRYGWMNENYRNAFLAMIGQSGMKCVGGRGSSQGAGPGGRPQRPPIVTKTRMSDEDVDDDNVDSVVMSVRNFDPLNRGHEEVTKNHACRSLEQSRQHRETLELSRPLVKEVRVHYT